jgi:hypothetical protein
MLSVGGMSMWGSAGAAEVNHWSVQSMYNDAQHFKLEYVAQTTRAFEESSCLCIRKLHAKGPPLRQK